MKTLSDWTFLPKPKTAAVRVPLTTDDVDKAMWDIQKALTNIRSSLDSWERALDLSERISMARKRSGQEAYPRLSKLQDRINDAWRLPGDLMRFMKLLKEVRNDVLDTEEQWRPTIVR